MIRPYAICLLAAALPAQQRLVANIEVSPLSPNIPSFSAFAVAGSKAYMRSSIDPWSAWMTDGTRAGTRPMHNLGGSGIVAFGGGDRLLMASAIPGLGAEPCTFDGATLELRVLKDINPGTANSFPSGFSRLGSHAYFAANDGAHGNQIWRTDGTETGTELVTNLPFTSSITRLQSNGTALYFVASTAATGLEVWRSDGTAAGTTTAGEIQAGPGGAFLINELVTFGQGALFATDRPYGSDGTTVELLIAANCQPRSFVDLGNGTAVFVANDALGHPQLWRTDGTAQGTVKLTDVPDVGSDAFSALIGLDDLAVFTLNFASQREPWRTDGTVAGTYLLADIGGNASSDAKGYTRVGDEVWFSARTLALGEELYHTDGTTAGTGLLCDLIPGPFGSTPRDMIAFGPDRVLMNSYVDGGSMAPTISDGTLDGTLLLTSGWTNAGHSLPNHFTALGDRVVFRAGRQADIGPELFVTDGTPEGTGLVLDIYPGVNGSSPDNFCSLGEVVTFAAAAASNQRRLWRTDGTAAGTEAIGPAPELPKAFGDRVVFRASSGGSGFEPWLSDGTAAGTNLLLDVRPGSASSLPEAFCAVGTQMFFVANDGSNGREPWVTDGTAVGTAMLADIAAGTAGSSITAMVAFDGYCYFAATGAEGAELWRSGGTPATTGLFADLRPGASGSAPANLTVAGGRLFFTADDGTGGGRTLWATDGTAGGTAEVADLVDGTAFPIVDPVGSTTGLFFLCNDGTGRGECLFHSDGTAAGTVCLLDLGPFGYGGFEHGTTTAILGGSMVAFVADDLVAGRQLWVSSGTAAGTQRMSSIGQVGAFRIENVAAIGLDIYANVWDDDNGSEPWLFEMSATQIAFLAHYGSTCHTSFGAPLQIDGTGDPTIGDATFGITIAGHDIDTAAFLFYSFDMRQAATCSLDILPPITLLSAHALTANTTTTAPLPIPNNPAVAGADLYWQWAMLHPIPGFVGMFDLTGGMQTHLGF